MTALYLQIYIVYIWSQDKHPQLLYNPTGPPGHFGYWNLESSFQKKMNTLTCPSCSLASREEQRWGKCPSWYVCESNLPHHDPPPQLTHKCLRFWGTGERRRREKCFQFVRERPRLWLRNKPLGARGEGESERGRERERVVSAAINKPWQVLSASENIQVHNEQFIKSGSLKAEA